MEETLYGSITKVTYFSDETHFGVVRIKLDYQDRKIAKYRAKLFTNLLTVTCSFDRKPLIDEEFDFTGEFITNQYGVQFKASNFSRRNENTLEGVITYLSSELFPGVGKVAATKIFKELGKDCLKLIESDKKALDKVDITENQKETVYVNLLDYESNKRVIVRLLNLGITMKTSLKLIKILGDNVNEIIEDNPYQLIDLVEGFGFKRADKIALELGIKKDSDARIQALLLYLIKQLTFSSGDTYLEHDDLFLRAHNETNEVEEIITKENFENNLKKLLISNKIIIDEEKNIYDFRLYNSEKLLAQKIKEFLNRDLQLGYNINDINKSLEKITKENKIIYSEKQQEAILSALKERFIIITGGPGTGKSTIIKAIIDCFIDLYPNEIIKEKIALVAPTGRASKRLKEVTDHPAMTIHRFLGYEGNGIFKSGPDAKVDAKILIIDEVSMVDVMLAARLFSSLEDDVKIILVGDVDQLPSVAPGEVLADLINSKEITTIKLDKIHRQATNSSIISLAHSINNGLIPENILEIQHDRNFLKMQDSDIISNILKTVDQAMNKGMDLIRDIQILIPMYKGEVGIHAINHNMQERFNPHTGKEIKNMNRVFRVNDKVIQLVNRSEKNVMNGDIGYVLSLDFQNNEYQGLTVMYEFGAVDYQKDELEDITHAYAISIHKSQGSEFDLVIVPFSFKYYIMLKRKLIYTAITRAKKYLIMVGSIQALVKGVKGIESKRKTKLVEQIKENFNNFDDIKNVDILEMEKVSPYDFMD